jgi:hypothetical protein
MHTTQSLKTKKKNRIVFSYNKDNFKKIYILACILTLITSLLRSRELGQYFKQIKNILFCFNVCYYEYIRKTYFRY